MANTLETDWDEGSPTINQPRRAGAAEIHSLRRGVRLRLAKEHDTLAAASVGGEHKEGSAKVYYQSAAPTLRPDGLTSLDSSDQGRLWLDSDTMVMKVWSGSAWLDYETFALTAQFEKLDGAASPTLPLTQAGLTNGTWLVWLTGTHGDFTDNSPFILSATINGTTRTLNVAKASGGTPPFSLMFHVVVSVGTCSLTAVSNVDAIQGMSGILTVPSP